MHLFSKHKGKASSFHFYIHIHALSPFPASYPTLAVEWHRGSSKKGSTKAAGPTRQPGTAWGTYNWEETQHVPCTLYTGAAATPAKKGKGSPGGGYERKELQLVIVDCSTKARTSLGTATLNLADLASADRLQQSVAIAVGKRIAAEAGGTPKLLITISCSVSDTAPVVEGGTSFSEVGDIPTTLSSDDEGSRPVSRNEDRPSSATGSRGAALPAVGEGAAQAEELYDSDGFLRESLDEERPPQFAAASAAAPQLGSSGAAGTPGGSVKRNLGSVLDQVDAESPAGQEARSQPGSAGRAASGRSWGSAGGATAAAAPAAASPSGSNRSLGGRQQDEGVAAESAAMSAQPGEPNTPLDDAGLAGGLASPQPWSTGQSSLSAGADPAVPFSMRPSTMQRRFVRDDAPASTRRWMWRHQAAAAPGAKAAGGGDSQPRGGQPGQAVPAAASQMSEGAHSSSSHLEESAASHLDSNGSAAHLAGSSPPRPPAGAAASASQAESGSPFSKATAAAAAAAGGVNGGAGPAGLRRRPTGGLGGSADREQSTSGLLLALSREESLFGGSNSLPAPPEGSMELLVRELLTTAALESAVYQAGGRSSFRPAGVLGSSSSSSPAAASKTLHVPARRLARTMLSLGPAEGRVFALRAIKAIQAVCGAATGDLHRLSYWWSNVLQLRWMVWALQDPQLGAGQGADARGSANGSANKETAWLSEVLAPALLDLECLLFDEMLKFLWLGVLLQRLSGGGSGRGSTPPSSAPSPARTPSAANGQLSAQQTPTQQAAQQAQQQPLQRTITLESPGSYMSQGLLRSFETPEEEAVHRWVRALGAVQSLLADPYRPPSAPRSHLQLLHRQLIMALLRRTDTLLFRKLLAGDDSEGGSAFSPSRSALLRSTSFMEDVVGAGPLPLDPSALPFQRGPLTFSVGVSLKMAVSRLTQWAADAGVKEDRVARASTEMNDYRLFPCLRATADLLMMPKEVLSDGEIRREVVPGLPVRRVVQILRRFEPDEFAPEPVPPGLLEQLENETPTSGAPPSPTVKRSEQYAPPSEEALLQEGLIVSSSLKMDDDSDDELDALAEAQGEGEGGSHAHRFELLRELWTRAR